MSRLFFSFSLFFFMTDSFAQKSNFGIINYIIPAGYESIQNDNVITYYKEDKITGAFCNFFIYNLMPGKGSVQQDFDFAWNKLVQGPFKFNAEPALQPEAVLKGWKFLLGNTRYNDNGVATLAMLVSFSGENNMQSVCILSNSDKYKADIESFIASVDMAREITKSTSTQDPNSNSVTANADNSIVGVWTFTDIQSTGQAQGKPGAMIGSASETGYKFNPDGTYYFFKKLNVNGTKKISFAYETGKWIVNNNRLAITPIKGQNEEWSANETVKSNFSSKLPGWGNKLRTIPRKLEPVTYTFEIKALPSAAFKSLLLQYDTPTERDGKYNYDPTNHLSRYSPYDPYPDILPPGFVPDFLNKTTESKTVTTKANSSASSKNIQYEVWECNCPNLETGTQVTTKLNTVVISSNGKSLYHMPEKGLNGVTPENSNQDGSWGNVTDKGNMLSLVNDKYGKMELYKINATSMSRYPNSKSSVYKKVKPVDGLRFDGAYSPELSYYNGKTDVISKQIDSNKRPIIFFKKDGTYINEGIAFSNITYGDDYAIGKGTYEIINFSLILSTQSGRKLQISFTPVLDENPAGTTTSGFIINNSLFYRLSKNFVPHN